MPLSPVALLLKLTTHRDRDALQKGIMIQATIVRVFTTFIAGLLYSLIWFVLEVMGIPCIAPSDLLDFDHGYLASFTTIAVVAGVYWAVSYMTKEYMIWAYEPTQALLTFTNNTPPAKKKQVATRGAKNGQ